MRIILSRAYTCELNQTADYQTVTIVLRSYWFNYIDKDVHKMIHDNYNIRSIFYTVAKNLKSNTWLHG